MNEHWSTSNSAQVRPYLFSFITLRMEYFGGFVFNPYVGLEITLDPMEAYIAGLCNGKNSCRQVIEAVQHRFMLPIRQIQQVLATTVDKLSNVCALAYRQREEQPSLYLPEMCDFATNAPCLSAPTKVIWDVTYACNLHCAHCLTASGKAWDNELTTQQALTLIDKLAEAKVFYLSLSGGEPFLRRDILTLLEHIATTNMRVDIASNGVILSKRVLQALRDLPVFQIQVSIDGIGEQHDRFRGRQGAFDTTCRTVGRLQAEGIAVSASTTVTAENVNDLDRIIDLAVRLKCCGFKAIPFLPAGRGQQNEQRLKLARVAQRRFAETMTRRQKELAGQLPISIESCFAFLLEPPPSTTSSNGSMGCVAGYDTLSIGADGTAYPCPFLHDFPLGNLIEQPVKALWNNAPVFHVLRNIEKQGMGEPCRSCLYAPIRCRGGCRAAAFFEYGDLLAADPNCFLVSID